jgi:hypothetical protein
MRTSLIALALLSTTAVAHADARRSSAAEPAAPQPHALSVGDVKSEVKPHDDAIGKCYVDALGETRGAGHLDLVFTVSRHGIVQQLDIVTPGLAPKQAQQIEACVRPLLAAVKFPARRTHTTATVPYFYQRTAAPNAGPQLSCWDPKGCKDAEILGSSKLKR